MMNHEIAIFAGGCFWCIEPVFSQLKGVKKVTSGYIGGHVSNPTYKDICTGNTGHAEAVRIEFDPSEVKFEKLLEIFFVSHDPTTPNRQGHDIGTQYRSAIFAQNQYQKDVARQFIENINQSGYFQDAVITEVNDNFEFYDAEDYHQHYYANNPNQPYCLAVAAPKVAKIRKLFEELLK